MIEKRIQLQFIYLRSQFSNGNQMEYNHGVNINILGISQD